MRRNLPRASAGAVDQTRRACLSSPRRGRAGVNSTCCRLPSVARIRVLLIIGGDSCAFETQKPDMR